MEGSAAPIAQRVSDAERDEAARILGGAVADGRLSYDTFLARLDVALTSRDELALREAVADLVGRRGPGALRAARGWRGRARAASVRLVPRRLGRGGQAPPAVSLPEPDRAAAYLSIGRAPDSDVRCEHPTVSAHHAGLVLFGGRWYVVDRGSTNGTFVNERRVDGVSPVEPGDLLGLGCATVVLERRVAQSASRERARRTT